MQWLIDHPEFAENHLGGGSYTGILIPVTVQKIYDGNTLTYLHDNNY